MYDYKYEPHHIIFMIDNKSFFASCEALRLGLNPITVCLAVISRQKGSNWGSGLIIAASPLAKKKYGLHNVMRTRDLPSKKEAPDLILVDPAVLKREFGIIGEQLFAESWGVDRSIISHKYHPKTKSYGNSQVLQRDYFDQRQIEIVIREVGEQVAARIRAHNLRSACVNLFIGYAFGEADYGDHRGGFNVQKTHSY